MKRLIVAPIVAAAALMGTSSATTVSGKTDVTAQRATSYQCGQLAADSSQVGKDQRWRQSFGLPCDADTVRRVTSGPHVSFPVGQGLVVAITFDEQENLSVRQAVLREMASQDFAAFALSLSGYAGSYFDHEAGGVATFLYTADPQQRWSALAERFPYPDYLTVRFANWSLSDLSRLESRIVADISRLAGSGIAVVLVQIDVQTNHVVVRVSDDPATVAPKLLARYGSAVRVERGKPIELTNVRPSR
jgi:hypothetical protein